MAVHMGWQFQNTIMEASATYSAAKRCRGIFQKSKICLLCHLSPAKTNDGVWELFSHLDLLGFSGLTGPFEIWLLPVGISYIVTFGLGTIFSEQSRR